MTKDEAGKLISTMFGEDAANVFKRNIDGNCISETDLSGIIKSGVYEISIGYAKFISRTNLEPNQDTFYLYIQTLK